MLLSMFISFLLARKFKGKIYVALMVVALVLISASSVGWIIFSDGQRHVVEPRCTPPLSLPFNFIRTYVQLTWRRGSWPVYSLRFFEFQIVEVFSERLSSGQVLLIYTFFLLVNIVGAIIGYWISKTTFIGRYFARRKTEEKDLVDDVV